MYEGSNVLFKGNQGIDIASTIHVKPCTYVIIIIPLHQFYYFIIDRTNDLFVKLPGQVDKNIQFYILHHTLKGVYLLLLCLTHFPR